MDQPGLPRTQYRLSRQILVRVSLVGALIVAVATVLCYYQVYMHSRDAKLMYLRQYMDERSKHENRIFTEAHNQVAFIRDEFMQLYLSSMEFSEDDFWRMYQVDKDGATRMKREYFDQRMDSSFGKQWGVSSFIGNNQSVASRDFQRRLLISYILVNRYGPAWWPGVLHITYPENAIVMFSPDFPWGLEAKPDLPMNELGTIKATLQSTNPERKPVWTSLYYDETAKYWTITYELPVDHEGRHLCNPSMDVHLEEIMTRLVTEHPQGAYNFIISADGGLVAHPGELTENEKWKGQLSLDKIENPDIVRIYHTLHDTMAMRGEGVHTVEDVEGKNYLLTFHLPGPDWWFVMVYPKSLISAEAHQTSRIVLLLGVSLFVLYYLVIYMVTNQQIRTPLRRMLHAISLVASKQYDALVEQPQLLPLDRKNEIGQLASAFLGMARQVRDFNKDLENVVESRTRELECANARLRDLSLLDGLTGIYNRRSFDRDIELVFREARSGVDSFVLMLADVDSFKKYNDMYGHAAGDDALRKISSQIAANIRTEDRVYRYGGEELAVIFNNANTETAQRVGQRILDSVRELELHHAGSEHGVVTISAGIVEFRGGFEHVVDMVNAADVLLYDAKSRGGNCIGAAPARAEQ